MEDEGCPLLIHQPSYSILNRWIERPGEDGESLLDVTARSGLGVIGFGPLAQGMLTDRYIDGIPADSRAAKNKTLEKDWLNEENLSMICSLNDIAGERGQSLAQMAISWVLRDQGIARLPRRCWVLLLWSRSSTTWARWTSLTSVRRSWLRLTTPPMTPASTAGQAPPPRAFAATRCGGARSLEQEQLER